MVGWVSVRRSYPRSEKSGRGAPQSLRRSALFACFGFGEPATTELVSRDAGHVGL
jgi:hypothetical protein